MPWKVVSLFQPHLLLTHTPRTFANGLPAVVEIVDVARLLVVYTIDGPQRLAFAFVIVGLAFCLAHLHVELIQRGLDQLPSLWRRPLPILGHGVSTKSERPKRGKGTGRGQGTAKQVKNYGEESRRRKRGAGDSSRRRGNEKKMALEKKLERRKLRLKGRIKCWAVKTRTEGHKKSHTTNAKIQKRKPVRCLLVNIADLS